MANSLLEPRFGQYRNQIESQFGNREPVDEDRLLSYKLRQQELQPMERRQFSNTRIPGNPYSYDMSPFSQGLSDIITAVVNRNKMRELLGDPKKYIETGEKIEETEAELQEEQADRANVSVGEGYESNTVDPVTGEPAQVGGKISFDRGLYEMDQQQQKIEGKKDQVASLREEQEGYAGVVRKIKDLESRQARNAAQAEAKREALAGLNELRREYEVKSWLQAQREQAQTERNDADNRTKKEIALAKALGESGSRWTDGKAKKYIDLQYGSDLARIRGQIDMKEDRLDSPYITDKKRAKLQGEIDDLYDKEQEINDKAMQDLIENGYYDDTGSSPYQVIRPGGQRTPAPLDENGNPVDDRGDAGGQGGGYQPNPMDDNPAPPAQQGQDPNVVQDQAGGQQGQMTREEWNDRLYEIGRMVQDRIPNATPEEKNRVINSFLESGGGDFQKHLESYTPNTPEQPEPAQSGAGNPTPDSVRTIDEAVGAFQQMGGGVFADDPFMEMIGQMDIQGGQVGQGIQQALDFREQKIKQFQKLKNEVDRIKRGSRGQANDLVEGKERRLQQLRDNIIQIEQGIAESAKSAQ